jgi:hypothetical protein
MLRASEEERRKKMAGNLPCPYCGGPDARRLDWVSEEAWVDYFRCDDCCAVWTLEKPEPRALPNQISHFLERQDLRRSA